METLNPAGTAHYGPAAVSVISEMPRGYLMPGTDTVSYRVLACRRCWPRLESEIEKITKVYSLTGAAGTCMVCGDRATRAACFKIVHEFAMPEFHAFMLKKGFDGPYDAPRACKCECRG